MSFRASADHSLLRKLNTSFILERLRVAGPLSRASLAGLTGMNRTTVSNVVSHLLDNGLVRETGLQSSEGGRPGVLLELNPQGGCAVGVDIGVDYVSVILTDFVANVLWRDRVYFYPTQDTESIFDRARQLIERALELGELRQLKHLGIGVGVPGLVDIREGILIFAPNLGWRNVSFPELWEKRFGVNVFVENESNAAALGEFYFGAAQGVSNLIFLSAGIGLGAGIILRGRLFRGSNGFAGEVGHITVNPNGERCGCGKRGCWETTAGTRAVVRRIQKAIAGNGDSRIASLCGKNPDLIDLDMVITAAEVGDSVALECLHETGEQLGIGIANLINTFNPEMVVIGGMLSQAGAILLPTVKATVEEHALPKLRNGVEIVLSEHGTDSCVMGAVALVMDDILKEPAL